MRNLIFNALFCFLLFPIVCNAQYYNTGQDPGSLRWMQIKTGKFTVIYPESYGDAGKDFARALDEAALKLKALYPGMRSRLPVIIHNYTTESNGYVAWAPSRMEIYPTPENGSIPLDPDTQLAVHELTHVLQMESLNKGFTKAISFIAGQQFPGAVSSLLPLWFLEGDAVFSESLLTESGRGRSPSFQKKLKALIVEKGSLYKYDKIINGSFRNYVPDHYQSGYQMMAWSGSKYNRKLWSDALRSTANLPFLLNPVNLSLRKSESLTKKRIFTETFDSLRAIWSEDVKKSGSISYETVNPSKGKGYVNYYSPVSAGDDRIIAVKTSLTEPPCFVVINTADKTEKKIHTPGYCYPYQISFGSGKLVWVETHSDPRWENRSWSVIKIMDIKEKTTRQLSFKTRYMSASISPDGNYIAASENSVANRNSLVIIDAWNGKILEKTESPGNAFLQRPAWDNLNKAVTVICLTEQGEGIMSYSKGEKSWKKLINDGRDDLQSAFLRNDSLFYVSSSSGTDNIYLLSPKNKVVYLTNSRFGISDMSVTGNKLLFSDYTSSGNNICSTILENGGPYKEPVRSDASFLINRFKQPAGISNSAENKTYIPVPYRKWQHLFRFHSWMPFYADIEAVKADPAAVKPGLTLLSQNNLGTLISSFGYEYSEGRNKLHSGIKWLGWYLQLETKIDYGSSVSVEKFNQTVADPLTVFNRYEWTNTLSLPLTFSGGSFTQYLYLSAASDFTNDYIYLKEKGSYDYGQNQITGRVYFSNYFRSAYRDIHPRWAQVLDLSYTYYPFDKSIYGDILTFKSTFYVPGFLKNNGFKFRFEAEKQNPEKFILGNRASFSRSYNDIISKDVKFASVDYFMPLAYPDFNLSSLLYLTRIRGDFFYDHTKGTGNYVYALTPEGRTRQFHNYSETFRSFGVQLMADYYILRIPFMITSGVEAAWRNPDESPYIKLFFNIDLFGMNIGKRSN